MHHNLVVLVHPKNSKLAVLLFLLCLYSSPTYASNPLKHEVICVTTLHWTICLTVDWRCSAIQQITRYIQILQIADTRLYYSEYIVNGSRGNSLCAFLPFLKNWGEGNSDDRYLCLFVARVFMENCVHSLVLTKTNAHFASKHWQCVAVQRANT